MDKSGYIGQAWKDSTPFQLECTAIEQSKKQPFPRQLLEQ